MLQHRSRRRFAATLTSARSNARSARAAPTRRWRASARTAAASCCGARRARPTNCMKYPGLDGARLQARRLRKARCLKPRSSAACRKRSATSRTIASGSILPRGATCRRTSPSSIHSWRRRSSTPKCSRQSQGIARFRALFQLSPGREHERFPVALYLAPDPDEPFAALTDGVFRAFPGLSAFRRQVRNRGAAHHRRAWR